MVGGIRNTISTSELRIAQNRIAVEEQNRKDVQVKREIAVDSLRKYQSQILELDNNVEVAGELGPLKYLSGLTGYPMDKIINILLLVIIFVFDPLAVSLVIAANFAWLKAFPRTRENLYGEEVIDKPLSNKEQKNQYIKEHGKHWATEDDKRVETDWRDYSEEDEKRMDIIGQNGNDGEHYDLDVNNDGLIDKNDIKIAQNRSQEIEKILNNTPNLSKEWIKKLSKEKRDIDDYLTKTY